MVEHKDIVIAVFAAAVGLAGIVLIFMGFISSNAEGFQNNTTKRKVKWVARAGLIPFISGLASAWFSLAWLENQNPHDYSGAILWFKIATIWTLLYGIISVLFFL